MRTLISSSYLSSFCEYCGTKTMTHVKCLGVDSYPESPNLFKLIQHILIHLYRYVLRNKTKWRLSFFKSLLSPVHQVYWGDEGSDRMHLASKSHLPSQPGPPVTSGCWSQFSTLPQAQSICWCFRQGDKVAKEKKRGWRKRREAREDRTRSRQGKKGRCKVRKREGEDIK